MRILVTGAGGQLGLELETAVETSGLEEGHSWFWIDQEDLDLAELEKIEPFLDAIRPDLIVHTAGFSGVDLAETQPALAYRLNTEATSLIAKWCADHLARMIYISSHYIFDGEANDPYVENDEPAALNVYGLTKAAGEKAVLDSTCWSLIVRTGWIFSREGENFVTHLRSEFQKAASLRIVSDQIGSPTYAVDLAKFLADWAILETTPLWPSETSQEIINYSNSGEISWATFAKAIARELKSEVEIIPISKDEESSPALRPTYTVLSNDKVEELTGERPRLWLEALRECLQQIQ